LDRESDPASGDCSTGTHCGVDALAIRGRLLASLIKTEVIIDVSLEGRDAGLGDQSNFLFIYGICRSTMVKAAPHFVGFSEFLRRNQVVK
jgi:hypothetical protein